MTYLNNTLKAIIITSVLVVTGCSSPAMDKDNENAARNRGAAGGVAGSMKDLDDSRQSENTQVLADGHSQDNRSDAEKRVAELEAELRIMELEQQLAEAKEKETSTSDDKS